MGALAEMVMVVYEALPQGTIFDESPQLVYSDIPWHSVVWSGTASERQWLDRQRAAPVQ